MAVLRLGKATLDSVYWVPSCDINNLEYFKDLLTFKPTFANLNPVPVFKESNGQFGIPRHYPAVYEEVVDRRTEGSKSCSTDCRTYSSPFSDMR